MKVYKAKTILKGSAIGVRYEKVVAVPQKYCILGEVIVTHGNYTMRIPAGNEPLMTISQEGKFTPFNLNYYEWKPDRLEFRGTISKEATE